MIFLTDEPGMSLYVDGQYRGRLDNSTLSFPPKDEYGRGGYGILVDLGDTNLHYFHIGKTVLVTNQPPMKIRATPNVEYIQSRFVSLKPDSPPGPSGPSASSGPSGPSVSSGPSGLTRPSSATGGKGNVDHRTIERVAWFVIVLCPCILGLVLAIKGPEWLHGRVSVQPAQDWPMFLTNLHGMHCKGMICRGGVGTVYLVDTKLKQNVALKVLHREHAANPVTRETFIREYYVLKLLESTCVVPQVFEVSHQFESQPWFTMTYLEKYISLRSWLDKRKRAATPWRKVRHIMLNTCEAISRIHSKGYVHRDISPANIMLKSDLTVIMIDFDSAKMPNVHDNNTPCIGKRYYTAPEQWRNISAASYKSDAFSLGAVWWELVTGHVPYNDTRNEAEMLRVHQQLTAMHKGALARVPPRVTSALLSLLYPVASLRPDLAECAKIIFLS